MRGGCGSKIWVSPQNIFTPHRFACGLTPLAHRLPLKGGVVFPLSSVADDHQGGSNRGKPHIPLPRNPVFHKIPLSFRIIVFIRHCFGKDTLGNMSPRFAYGLAPLAHRQSLILQSGLTLKGGVFSSVPANTASRILSPSTSPLSARQSPPSAARNRSRLALPSPRVDNGFFSYLRSSICSSHCIPT